MSDFLKKMFSNSEEVSETRVMSMMSLVTGIIIAVYGLYRYSPNDLSNVTMLSSMFVGIAFSGKIAGKFVDNNSKSPTSLDLGNK